MPKLSDSQFSNSLPRWSQKILLSLLGFLLVGAVMYFQSEVVGLRTSADSNREAITTTDQSVVRLEVQFDMIERSLNRIENSLDSMRN